MSDDDDVRWWMANSGQKGSSGYSPDSKDFHLLSSVSAPGWEVDLCELCIEKQRCSLRQEEEDSILSDAIFFE